MPTLYLYKRKNELFTIMYLQLRRSWTQSVRCVQLKFLGENENFSFFAYLSTCRYPIIKNNGETLRLYHGTRHCGREIEGNSCVDMGYTTPVLVGRHAPRELWGLGLPLSINPSMVG